MRVPEKVRLAGTELEWWYDFQHNDAQRNDTQHNDIQHTNKKCDTEHNYIQQNDSVIC
jgi:hypothetical protein